LLCPLFSFGPANCCGAASEPLAAPEHLKRYKDFAACCFKYGRRDMVERAGLNELLPQEPDEEPERIPEARELARDVEKLGPTYVKLAQLLSTRPDIIPPVYAEALVAAAGPSRGVQLRRSRGRS